MSTAAPATTPEPVTQTPTPTEASPAAAAQLSLLIDGLCPLCRHEADLLMKLDKGRGKLAMIDIAAPGFDASVYGLDNPTVNRYIHAVTASGETVTGLEVFRRAYGLVGWGWLWAPTGWPVLRVGFNAMYRWFAKNRHRITFRKDVCETGACAIPPERGNAS